MRTPYLAALAVASLASTPILAQTMRLAFPPPAEGIRVDMNQEIGTVGGTTLHMDVYKPPARVTAPRGYPVLVFFNRAVGAERNNDFYAGWARFAASRGMVAILPDLRDGKQEEDFRVLMNFLGEHATHLGMDRDAIAVFAGSGNAYTAFPILESDAAQLVRAAVLYYGAGNPSNFRLDLPVLMVRAGLDRPGVNRDMIAVATRAMQQNAPVTLLNYPTGHHAFEMVDHNDATRDVLEQTVAWLARAMDPTTRRAMLAGLPEADAAGAAQSGDYARAARLYAALVAQAPNDARMRLSWGEALLGAGEFAKACEEMEALRGKGLGPRDVGLPSARACVQAGNADAAIRWLESIPARFMPPTVASEPVFAPLRELAAFKAVFERR